MTVATTNFNVSPYYDDYDEDKGFLRVLFRPAYSIQARELTQLQTILQKQVTRTGDFLIKDGSPVTGGELTLDTDISYVKLLTTYGGSTITANNFLNKTVISSSTSTSRAQVVAISEASGDDDPTLMVKYLGPTTFGNSESIIVEDSADSNTATSIAASATGTGSVVSITEGVYYTSGFFVKVAAQSLILDKYTNTPSYRIGLTTTESIVDSATDTTLLDPAAGTYNANAPGATRFKIELTLAKKSTSSTDPVEANATANFIELMRTESGIPVKHVKYPVFGAIEKTMARRTYDESGDYTIKPFPIQIIDHQGATGTTAVNQPSSSSGDTITITGTGTEFSNEFAVNDVINLSSDTSSSANVTAITNATSMSVSLNQTGLGDGTTQTIYNESKVSAAMEPGKAYAKGYEFETMATQYVDVRRGRDVVTANSFTVATNMGAFFKVAMLNKDVDGAGASGLWNPTGEDASANTAEQVDMHCLPMLASGANNSIGLGRANTDGGTTAAVAVYNSSKIGTAQVRQIDYSDGTPGNNDETDTNRERYDFYVYNMQFAAVSNTVVGNAVTAVGQQELGLSAAGENIILETANSTFVDIVVNENAAEIDSNGQANFIKAGTVAVSQNSNTITGTDTTFSTDFYVNDIFSVQGLPSSGARTYAKVVSITSDTVMTANTQLNSGTAVTGKYIYNETMYRASDDDATRLHIRQASDIDDAYNGSTVTIGSETRKILDYDGTANTATLNVAFSTNVSTEDTYSLNFGIKDIESFANATVGATTVVTNKTVNIDVEGRFTTLDPSSNTKLYESDTNTLLFPIPQSNIKTTKPSSAVGTYDIKRHYANQLFTTSSSSAGVTTLSGVGSGGTRVFKGGASSTKTGSATYNDYIVVVSDSSPSGTSGRANGEVVKLASAVVSGAGTGVVLTANLKYANVGSSADIFKADVIATISVSARDSKQKLLLQVMLLII